MTSSTYGPYNMDLDIVREFVAWMIRQGHPAGHVLSCKQPKSKAFRKCWDMLSIIDEFNVLQNKYMEGKRC